MDIYYLAYRGQGNSWEYREAWADEAAAEFVVHYGACGHMGKTSARPFTSEAEAEEFLAAFIASCEEDGYHPLTEEHYGVVEACWKLKTADGTARDHGFANKIRHELTAHLGWRGLGELVSTEPELGNWVLKYQIRTPLVKKTREAVHSLARQAKLDPTKLSCRILSQPAQK